MHSTGKTRPRHELWTAPFSPELSGVHEKEPHSIRILANACLLRSLSSVSGRSERSSTLMFRPIQNQQYTTGHISSS